MCQKTVFVVPTQLDPRSPLTRRDYDHALDTAMALWMELHHIELIIASTELPVRETAQAIHRRCFNGTPSLVLPALTRPSSVDGEWISNAAQSLNTCWFDTRKRFPDEHLLVIGLPHLVSPLIVNKLQEMRAQHTSIVKEVLGSLRGGDLVILTLEQNPCGLWMEHIPKPDEDHSSFIRERLSRKIPVMAASA